MNKNITSTATDTQPQNEAHPLQAVLRFARIVRYRKDIMAVALLLGVLLGGLYFATATRVYESKASLLVLQTGAEQWSNNMSGDKVTKDLMATRLNELLIAAHEKRLEAQSRAAAIKAVLQNGENVRPCALAMIDSAAREVLLQQLKAATSDPSTIARTNQQLLENRAKLQAELRR